MQPHDFPTTFEALTGSPPFPWQSSLFAKFVADEIPASAAIPTGLGKTSIIAIWLSALAIKPEVTPRRLVYVVNRRTVVDQTTAEVELLTPEDGVSAGQACVFYAPEGSRIHGGGWIWRG